LYVKKIENKRILKVGPTFINFCQNEISLSDKNLINLKVVKQFY